MLNFAEQTGSGAVIVVWSFLSPRAEYYACYTSQGPKLGILHRKTAPKKFFPPPTLRATVHPQLSIQPYPVPVRVSPTSTLAKYNLNMSQTVPQMLPGRNKRYIPSDVSRKRTYHFTYLTSHSPATVTKVPNLPGTVAK